MLTYLDLRVSALVLLSVLAYMWNRHWSLAVIGSTFITCRYGGSSSCSNIRFLRRTDTRNSQFANTGSRVLCGGYEPKQPSPSNEDSKPRRDTRQLSVTVSSVTYSSYCSSVTFDEAHIHRANRRPQTRQQLSETLHRLFASLFLLCGLQSQEVTITGRTFLVCARATAIWLELGV